MKLLTNTYGNSNEISQSKLTTPNQTVDSNKEIAQSAAAVVDISSEIVIENEILKGHIKEQMNLIETAPNMIHIIEDNISNLLNDNLDQLELAVETIQNSMQGNPSSANDLKQELIGMITLNTPNV